MPSAGSPSLLGLLLLAATLLCLIQPARAQFFVNRTYIDVILEYVNYDDFSSEDQRFWPLLQEFCNLPVRAPRDGATATFRELERNRQRMAETRQQRCRILDAFEVSERPREPTPLEVVALYNMPSIHVRRTSNNLNYLPYAGFQYLLTIVHWGNEDALNEFMEILDTNRTFEHLGVVEANRLQNGDALYDSEFGGLALSTGQNELSFGWHVILVVGTLLVCAMGYTFYTRNLKGGGEQTDVIVGNGEENDDADEMALHRKGWEEHNLEGELEQHLVSSAKSEPKRIADMTKGTSHMGTAPRGSIYSPQRTTGGSPTNSPEFGPMVTEVSNGSFGFPSRSRQQKFNTQNLQIAMTLNPALTMPPSHEALAAQEREEKRLRAEIETKRRLEEEAAQIQDLPPVVDNEKLMDEARKKEAEEKEEAEAMKKAPMGLAARRMAAMMSTMKLSRGLMHPDTLPRKARLQRFMSVSHGSATPADSLKETPSFAADPDASIVVELEPGTAVVPLVEELDIPADTTTTATTGEEGQEVGGDQSTSVVGQPIDIEQL